MSGFVLLARAVLVAVFTVSGVAKLADRRGTVNAVASFGVPTWSVVPLAVAIPLSELAIACSLLVSASARWAALAGAALLAVFAVGIAVALANGRRPACHCFGELSRKPAGARTLLRTAALAALAVALAVALWTRPTPSLTHSLARVSPLAFAVFAAAVLLIVVFGFGAWLVTELLRQNGRLLRRLEGVEAMLGVRPPGTAVDSSEGGLALGVPAPAFRVATGAGGEASLDGLLGRGRPLVLVFTDPHCGPCRVLLPEIAGLQRRCAESLTLAVVVSGSLEQTQAWHAEHAVDDLLVAPDGELARAYGAVATPSALLVGADGRIASPVARGARAVRVLIEHSASEAAGGTPAQRTTAFRAAPRLSVQAGGPRAH